MATRIIRSGEIPRDPMQLPGLPVIERPALVPKGQAFAMLSGSGLAYQLVVHDLDDARDIAARPSAWRRHGAGLMFLRTESRNGWASSGNPAGPGGGDA